MSLLVAERLTRVFPQPRGAPLRAVDGVSFSVAAGEIVGLLGPNGAGKTTTIRMLAGLLRPTEGRALIDGIDVQRHPRRARRRLGYLSTTSGLPPRLTVREVLETFAAIQGAPRGAADRAIAEFRLGDFADRLVGQLSTGMLQRARIACAAVHEPPVLILDEPTAGLDVLSAHELMQHVRDARAAGRAVLFSTHVLAEADEVCDRIAIIAGGRLRAAGTPAELKALAGEDDLTRAFLALVGTG